MAAQYKKRPLLFYFFIFSFFCFFSIFILNQRHLLTHIHTKTTDRQTDGQTNKQQAHATFIRKRMADSNTGIDGHDGKQTANTRNEKEHIMDD